MSARLTAAAIAALLTLTACGTTDDPGPETPTPTPTTAVTAETTAPSPSPTATESGPATPNPTPTTPTASPLPRITQAPEHSGEAPELPRNFGEWTNLDPPRADRGMYQSDAGIFTTTLTRFTDANSQADAHIEAPEHRGNWLCGTIRDDNNACATNAWDASLWLQSGPDISVEDLAAAGDELLAAWQ